MISQFSRPSDLAQLVRAARLQAGISQRDLAEAIGKKKAWLCKKESGTERMPLPVAQALLTAIIDSLKAEK